jgi:hypothetical protein
MAGSSAEDEWIGRVLGVTIAGPSGGDPAAWKAARDAWQAALTTVDGQINALAKALFSSGDADMEDIAAHELGQMIAPDRAALLDLLRSVGAEDAAKSRAAAPKIRDAASAFRARLDGDPRIAACDANPFDVAVSIRSTLTKALAGLESAAESALSQ